MNIFFSPLLILKEQGFDIQSSNEEVTYSFHNYIKLVASNDNLLGFTFRIESEHKHVGLLTNVSVYDLDKDDPKVVISNFDSVSFFNDIGSIEEYGKIIDQIEFARKLSIKIAKEMIQAMETLKLQAINELKTQDEDQEKSAREAEDRRVLRTLNFKDKHRRLAAKEVESIMTEMEDNCKYQKKPVSRIFVFLKQDGFPVEKSLKVSWEKQQLNWRNHLNNTSDPKDIKEIIEKAWILN